MINRKMMIKFHKRAKLSLAETEKLATWDYHHWPESAGDPESFSYVKVENDSITLSGYQRVSPFRYFISRTLLNIIFPLYAKRKSVSIRGAEIHRVEVKRSLLRDIFHIFQRMPDGHTDVHVFFIAHENESAFFKQHINEIMPAGR